MRRLRMVIRAACHGQIVLPSNGEISIGVVGGVPDVVRFECVEATAYETWNQLVAREQSGMRERSDAA